MPGMPKRRAPEDIPEAGPARADARPDAPAHDARGRTRADARTRTRAREDGAGARVTPLQPGPATRAAADQAQAEAAATLAEQLSPGVVVRLERTQPRWAAGWLEDNALELGEVGELYDYVREEYGGRVYRVTVLSPGGHPLFSSRLNIAGPPRHNGRVINRAEWESDGDDAAHARPAAAAAGGDAMAPFVQLLGMVIASNREAGEAQAQAMKAAMESNTKQTQRLMELVVEDRAERERGQSLSGQLTALVESAKTLRKAGKLFGAAGGDAPAAATPDLMEGAKAQALEHFLGNILQSEFPSEKRQPPPPRERSRPRPQPHQSGVKPITPGAIPEAKPRG